MVIQNALARGATEHGRRAVPAGPSREPGRSIALQLSTNGDRDGAIPMRRNILSEGEPPTVWRTRGARPVDGDAERGGSCVLTSLRRRVETKPGER